MDSDLASACLTAIGICEDFDTACLTVAACDSTNEAECTSSIEAGYHCSTGRHVLTTTATMSSYPFISEVTILGATKLEST
jgi:hypothetical protein